MDINQYIVFAILLCSLALFIWGRWRYDIVALMALLAVTLCGLVPTDKAFSGFGHPAVITVAAVLIISRGLINSGAIDALTNQLHRLGSNISLQVLGLTLTVAAISAFMNNVGALAIMLPVALQMARKNGQPASLFLMPIAFGSLLGGMTTMMGTPPNVIIAMVRSEYAGEPFHLFDFTPVGAVVALAGIVFISLIGWRLIPRRTGQGPADALFHIEDYTTEVKITKNSTIAGIMIADLARFKDIEINIIGIARGGHIIVQPSPHERIQEGDILVIEAGSDDLKNFVGNARLELAGDKQLEKDILGSKDMLMAEAVIRTDSALIGKTAYSLNLRSRFGLNLLAVSRRGARPNQRIARLHFEPGDVLLMSGPSESIHETISGLGCIPLAQRDLRIGQPRQIIKSGAVFLGAIIFSATGLMAIQSALVLAAVAMVLLNIISVREVYENINWSVIILLGAMIPVGSALETTGAAQTIVVQLLKLTGDMPPIVSLALIFFGTMYLTDIINNAAAALLIAPIAIKAAVMLHVSPDPFLMAVAISASCAFMTPIGHQSNTLVMGPGGYKFGDYWRMGLPLGLLVAVIAILMIILVWPF